MSSFLWDSVRPTSWKNLTIKNQKHLHQYKQKFHLVLVELLMVWNWTKLPIMIYSMLMQLRAQRYMNFEIGHKSTIYVGILLRFKCKLHTVCKFKNIFYIILLTWNQLFFLVNSAFGIYKTTEKCHRCSFLDQSFTKIDFT